MQRGYHDVQGVGGWRGAQVGSHGVVEGARRMERCTSGVTWSRGGARRMERCTSGVMWCRGRGQEDGEVHQWGHGGAGRMERCTSGVMEGPGGWRGAPVVGLGSISLGIVLLNNKNYAGIIGRLS